MILLNSFASAALYFILICVSLTSFAQSVNRPPEIPYNTITQPGKVTTVEGTELKGLVSFNKNDCIVTITTDADTKSYSAKRLISFELNKSGQKEKSLFYSLIFPDSQTVAGDPEFFEVLTEFENFAVLLRHRGLEIYTNYDSGPYSIRRSYSTHLIATPYFMDSEGHFFLYDDKDVLKRFLGKYYSDLKKYAREHHLSFREVDDIKPIMEQYKRLSNQ